MTYLHMHHVMANRAQMQAQYTEGLINKPQRLRERIQELVLSGAVDYKSGLGENITVTDEDRHLVLQYLGY